MAGSLSFVLARPLWLNILRGHKPRSCPGIARRLGWELLTEYYHSRNWSESNRLLLQYSEPQRSISTAYCGLLCRPWSPFQANPAITRHPRRRGRYLYKVLNRMSNSVRVWRGIMPSTDQCPSKAGSTVLVLWTGGVWMYVSVSLPIDIISLVIG